LTSEEQTAITAGLRSSNAFTLRRCQVVLASSRRKRASHIAHDLGCAADTVTRAITAFNQRGLQALQPRSHRPHTVRAALDAEGVERLGALLCQSPRSFGKEAGVWTLALAAEVSFEQGLTSERVSAETIRASLARLGIKWKRAKHWLTSPDPAYGRKKEPATA
jgi:transposase